MRKLIFYNFWLKLFSLLLAGMIWYAVFSIQDKPKAVPGFNVGTQKKEFDQVPVVILKSPSDTAVYKISPNAVNVTVTGKPSQLETLTPADVRVFIDLSNMRAGSTKKSYQVSVHTPDPSLIVDVSPDLVFPERITP